MYLYEKRWENKVMLLLEKVSAAVAGGLCVNKGIRRWVYSALQVLF